MQTFVEVSASDGFVYPIFKTPAAIDRFCSLVERARFQWEIPPAGFSLQQNPASRK